MRLKHVRFLLGGLLGVVSCTPVTTEVNPFLAYADEFGVAGQQQQTAAGGAPSGGAAAATFRRDATISFRNNHTEAELNVSFVAWVDVSSIRSADQQDALLASGFTQLTHSESLGTPFTLPVGTFVYNGGGVAGATRLVLGAAQATSGTGTAATATPTERTFVLPTPDAILAFIESPVSCESVAFYFSRDGEPLTAVPEGGGGTAPFGGSTSTGPFKTMAQVDVYQCSPFRPGVFFSPTGTGLTPNEFVEGQRIIFDFNPTPDANGYFGKVTIETPETATTP
jgi:hypothetical protein